MIPDTPLSAAARERARKFHALALQRLASVGQVTVSEALGCSESTVSRCVNDNLERVCQVFAAIGLKVVPQEVKCYPSAQIDAIFTLAKSSIEKMDSADKLTFED